MTMTMFYRFIDGKKYEYYPQEGLFISYGANGKETERHLCGSYREADKYLRIIHPDHKYGNWKA